MPNWIPTHPAMSLQADFAGQRQAAGSMQRLPTTPPGMGDRIPMTLIWQAHAQPTADYAIFVQLRDAANTVVANADYQPYQGLLPLPLGRLVRSSTLSPGCNFQKVSHPVLITSMSACIVPII
ncbi:MAG: hypothetical protein U0401_28085 [Anaerolineae bacterium]